MHRGSLMVLPSGAQLCPVSFCSTPRRWRSLSAGSTLGSQSLLSPRLSMPDPIEYRRTNYPIVRRSVGYPIVRQMPVCLPHIPGRGGTSPRFWYATPPPSPPPPLVSCQGSTANGHTYRGAKGARIIFFSFPLPILSTLHPNTILEPNLDSDAHPNPQPTPNPTHKPYP